VLLVWHAEDLFFSSKKWDQIAMNSKRSFTRHLGRSLTAAVLILGCSSVSTTIAFGQAHNDIEGAPAPAAEETEQAMILEGLAVYKEAGCRSCHGWAANGEPEGPNPRGPSLRASQMDYDIFHLTIACGRPGTEMPYFWRNAYRTNSTECYGVTAADLGVNLPPQSSIRLNTADVDAVTYFIANYVNGLDEITFEQCEFYFGVGDARCPQYAR